MLSANGVDVTSANLQQHLINEKNLELRRLENHQQAAAYASLAPSVPSYTYSANGSNRSSFSQLGPASSSTDSESHNEVATPEEAPESWPYSVTDLSAQNPLKKHIESFEQQSERELERITVAPPPQRPLGPQRFSSSATMTKEKFEQNSLPTLAALYLNTPDTDSPSERPSPVAKAAGRTTSPNSWRSLLPDNDPYFAAMESQRGSSSSDSHQTASTSSINTGRTSMSSANSVASLNDCAGDSWRSLLPASDRSDSASLLSLPLAPPISALLARDAAAASKRHSSFSDIGTSQSAAARQMLDGMRAYPSMSSLVQSDFSERDSWPSNRKAPMSPSTTTSKKPTRPTTPRKLTSCSVSTPQSPCTLPFLDSRPAPQETNLTIETTPARYTLVMSLPGFSLDCITLATKQHQHHRTLHIVADKWDSESGGHFERRVTFPDNNCDLKNVKAEFDGTILRVYVPRTTTNTT